MSLSTSQFSALRRWRWQWSHGFSGGAVAFYRAGSALLSSTCVYCFAPSLCCFTRSLRLVRPKWGSEQAPRQSTTRALLKLFRWFLLLATALLSSLSQRDKVKAKYIYSSSSSIFFCFSAIQNNYTRAISDPTQVVNSIPWFVCSKEVNLKQAWNFVSSLDREISLL